MSQITLGALIAKLEDVDPNLVLEMGFSRPHSSRAYYQCLGLEPSYGITVGECLENIRPAVGETYQGYKGGDFTMDTRSFVFLAIEGECGEELTELAVDLMLRAATKAATKDVDDGWIAHVEESAERMAPSLVEVTSSLKGMALTFERVAAAMEEHITALRAFALESQSTEEAASTLSPSTQVADTVGRLRDGWWPENRTTRLRIHLAEYLTERAAHLGQAHPDWQRAEVSTALMDLVRFINSED